MTAASFWITGAALVSFVIAWQWLEHSGRVSLRGVRTCILAWAAIYAGLGLFLFASASFPRPLTSAEEQVVRDHLPQELATRISELGTAAQRAEHAHGSLAMIMLLMWVPLLLVINRYLPQLPRREASHAASHEQPA